MSNCDADLANNRYGSLSWRAAYVRRLDGVLIDVLVFAVLDLRLARAAARLSLSGTTPETSIVHTIGCGPDAALSRIARARE